MQLNREIIMAALGAIAVLLFRSLPSFADAKKDDQGFRFGKPKAMLAMSAVIVAFPFIMSTCVDSLSKPSTSFSPSFEVEVRNLQGFSTASTPVYTDKALLSVHKRLSDASIERNSGDNSDLTNALNSTNATYVWNASDASFNESCSFGASSFCADGFDIKTEAKTSLFDSTASFSASFASAMRHLFGDNSVDAEVQAPVLAPAETEQIHIHLEETHTTRPEVLTRQGPLTVALVKEKISTQSVGDVIFYKSAYWGKVQVGTPAQTFSLIFDTGSGHLILPSSYCHSNACKAHSRFRRSTSQTANDINTNGEVVAPGQMRDQLTVSFGTGEVSGVFVEDLVCFEDSNSSLDPENSGECFNMRFIAATAMSEDPFKDFVFDGIMGLGLSSLSQTEHFNFLHVLSNHPRVRDSGHAQTFAIFLGLYEHEQSELTLGGWSDQRLKVEEEIKWTPVLHPELGHWLIRVKSISVDGEVIDFCSDGQCQGVVDSGTSLVSLPTQVFPEVYEMLRHQAPVDGICGSDGPKLQIELDGLNITLDPQDYAHLMSSKKSTTPDWGSSREWTANDTRRDKICKPLFMAMDFEGELSKLFILGEPVLRKYYTIYDAEAKRVGFGLAEHRDAVHIETADEDDDWFDLEFEDLPVEEEAVEEVPAPQESQGVAFSNAAPCDRTEESKESKSGTCLAQVMHYTSRSASWTMR